MVANDASRYVATNDSLNYFLVALHATKVPRLSETVDNNLSLALFYRLASWVRLV